MTIEPIENFHLTKKQEEIAEKMISLINDFINNFTKIMDPRKFKGQEQFFVNVAMSPATMIASTIIDKLSETFGIDQKELISVFNNGLLHGIEMSKEAHRIKQESH